MWLEIFQKKTARKTEAACLCKNSRFSFQRKRAAGSSLPVRKGTDDNFPGFSVHLLRAASCGFGDSSFQSHQRTAGNAFRFSALLLKSVGYRFRNSPSHHHQKIAGNASGISTLLLRAVGYRFIAFLPNPIRRQPETPPRILFFF